MSDHTPENELGEKRELNLSFDSEGTPLGGMVYLAPRELLELGVDPWEKEPIEYFVDSEGLHFDSQSGEGEDLPNRD